MKSSKNGSFIFSVSCNLLEFADLLCVYIYNTWQTSGTVWWLFLGVFKNNFVVHLQEISDTYSLQLAEIFMLVLSQILLE